LKAIAWVKSLGKWADAGIAVRTLFAGLKEDEDIMSLGIEAIVDKAEASRDVLLQAVKAISTWKYDKGEFKEKRAAVDKDIETYKANFKELLDYHKALSESHSTMRKENTLEKRKKGYKEAKQASAYEMCPLSLAKAFARIGEIRGTTNDVVYNPDVRMCCYDAQTTDFKDPFVWNLKNCEQFTDSWEAELARFGWKLTELVHKKTIKLAKQCSANNTAHCAVSFLQQGELALDLSLAPLQIAGCKPWPVLCVQQHQFFQFDRSIVPFQGPASLLMPMHGYLHVCFVKVGKVITDGFGLDNLKDEFEKITKKKLAENEVAPLGALAESVSVGIPKGAFAFVPFGWIPLIASTDNSEEEKSVEYIEEFGSYLQVYLNLEPCDEISDVVKAEIHSQLQNGLKGGNKIIKAFAADVEEYLAAFRFKNLNVLAPLVQ
jgi:hypothetical protein